MATTRLQLIKNVALRMDEVSPDITISGITIDGSDNNPLYALIDGLVDAGALELFSVAPYWRLPQTAFESTSINFGTMPSTHGSRRYIRLRVPDDFLRVAEIECSAFERPITEVVPEGSDMGKRQHNRHLMAREAKPVGVMSHGLWGTGLSAEKCREIDCYSIQSGSTTPQINASYIARPYMPDSGSNDDIEDDIIPAVLIPALEWLIAARTFGARGDANHAAICQQNAQNLLV